MIRIVGTFAGLGNQMFQYAFFKRIEKEFGATDQVYLKVRKRNKHHGILLRDVFNLDYNGLSPLWVRVLFDKQIAKQSLRLLSGLRQDDEGEAIDLFSDKIPDKRLIYYYGFWQDENYFKPVENEVREAFSFRKSPVSPANLSLAEQLKQELSVSIHIRRGDYESKPDTQHGGVCTMQYYRNAVDYMISQLGDHAHFYIFSDDPKWVEANFPLEKCTMINGNQGKDGWQDMFLMSQCKHNIIANSSFSWWGAWLNSNQNKIVLTPDRWTRRGEPSRIIPDLWTRIRIE